VLAVLAAARAWQQREMAQGPVPAFTARAVDGAAVSPDRFAGRTWLVYFWGAWCPACELQAGAVSEVARDWPVLTVALRSGGAGTVEAHLRAQGLDWRTVADPDGTLARRFGVRAVPALFVIDGEGQIRFREVGYTTGPGLRARLRLAGWLEDG
jgi:peroxiredoxin